MQHKCLQCGSTFLDDDPKVLYCRVCIRDGVRPKPLPHYPRDKKIAIFITTMNEWQLTKDTIVSLKQHTNYKVDIIVLDGASTDGTPDKVRDKFSDVKVLELDKPYWVSYAWNRALEYGLENDYEYIGILNNDLLFAPNWFVHVMSCFNDPDVGYASPVQRTRLGAVRDMGKNRYGHSDYNLRWKGGQIVPVMWMPGACIILRSKAVRETGMFDESFFFGCDEVDYCLRLWLKGWKVVSNSNVGIIHLVSQTISKHGGNAGRRAQDLYDNYGVVWVAPRKRFYEKWDLETLEAIYLTVKPLQEKAKGLTIRGVKIWQHQL